MYQVKTVVTHLLDENNYIIYQNGQALIIDPGSSPNRTKKSDRGTLPHSFSYFNYTWARGSYWRFRDYSPILRYSRLLQQRRTTLVERFCL